MADALPLGSGTAAAAVVERLQARQQQLAAEREQRQAQLQSQSDAREDITTFMDGFSSDHKQLQDQLLATCQQASSAGVQQDGAAKSALLGQLEGLSLKISQLEQSCSDAAYFLPPYELRSCTSQVQQLRSQVAESKQQLQPKRKFAFSKAVSRTTIPAPALTSTPADGVAAATYTIGTAAAQQQQAQPAAATAAPSTDTPQLSTQDQQLVASGHGFAGQRDKVLVASAQQLNGQGFVLHDLTDCQVFLLGAMSALRLQHLQRCSVYTGPVSGATFVDGCSSCTLMLASHQVRIHNAQGCDVYLRMRSRPIIEHSSKLQFAPYDTAALLCKQSQLQLQPTIQPSPQQQQQKQEQEQQQEQEQSVSVQLSQLLQAAELSEDTGLWQQVDDFGWVKASASPHWQLLPEADRQLPPATLPQAAEEQQQQEQEQAQHQQNQGQ